MRPEAVLFDRDGTLVVNVPYNGDPARVEPTSTAREALDRLRAARVPVAVVSNQSGVGRGYITIAQVEAVNRRLDELLGPFAAFVYCPHGPDDGCACRKPAPGLVFAAAESLGVAPGACALIGDQPGDLDAARAAGATPVLVPSPDTPPAARDRAAHVAATLAEAVHWLLTVS